MFWLWAADRAVTDELVFYVLGMVIGSAITATWLWPNYRRSKRR